MTYWYGEKFGIYSTLQGRLWSLGELTVKLCSKAEREVFFSHKVIWNERTWGSYTIFLVCLLGDFGEAASPLSLNMWPTILCVFQEEVLRSSQMAR